MFPHQITHSRALSVLSWPQMSLICDPEFWQPLHMPVFFLTWSTFLSTFGSRCSYISDLPFPVGLSGRISPLWRIFPSSGGLQLIFNFHCSASSPAGAKSKFLANNTEWQNESLSSGSWFGAAANRIMAQARCGSTSKFPLSSARPRMNDTRTQSGVTPSPFPKRVDKITEW